MSGTVTSGTLSPTVAATPATTDVAARLLSAMAALSGTATDYNIGSQIRTQAESLGSVVETQGYWTQALVLQGMLYGAMALFGLPIPSATAATGYVTFATAFSGAPAASQNVGIPTSTVIGTPGGIQFSVATSGVLTAGTTGVTLPVVATQSGTLGNVPSGSITTLLSSVGYPLQVYNFAATAGGLNQPTYSQAVSTFAAQVATLGLADPVAVANAAIGVTVSGEICNYASCYEPWIAAGSGAASGQAGFVLYIDNGSGVASANLTTAVALKILGNQATNQSGYRPVGVPNSVLSGTPIYVAVAVSGTLIPGTPNATAIAGLITQSVENYFATMQYGTTSVCEQPQIAAAAVNAALGYYSSISTTLSYASGGGPVSAVSGAYNGRVILASLTVTVG